MIFFTLAILNCLNAAIFCQELSPLPNGTVEYTGDDDGEVPFNYSTTATYICDEGYAVVGNSERNCSSGTGVSGEWNGLEPTCECKFYFTITISNVSLSISSAISCEPLHILNGQITYSSENISFDTVATLMCDGGFTLSGSENRICGGNGTSIIGEWSGDQTSCLFGKF